MEKKMSMQTRKEILSHTKARYMKANTKEKSKILDELIGITAYLRKYAIHLLNKKDANFTNDTNKLHKSTNKQKYYDEFCVNLRIS